MLFIAGEVSNGVAIEHLAKCMPRSDLRNHIEAIMASPDLTQVPVTERRKDFPVLYLLEVEGNGAQCLNVGCAFKVNGRDIISNSEILQCHTFTKCIVCVVVPPGYAIGDLCSPSESYQVLSYIGLGKANRDGNELKSQAYSGISTIEPNPTRADSMVSRNGQNETPDPALEPIQQAVETSGEQVLPTLAWPTGLSGNPNPTNRGNQQPIAPTKKKERPIVKPSSKIEAVPKHSTPTPLWHDQDVEMTDVLDGDLTKQGFAAGPESSCSKDPTESCSSTKPNNDDMEVDSEGANPNEAQQGQASQAQKASVDKLPKDAIAAIASPQKPRHKLTRPGGPKAIPSKPGGTNSNGVRRPPGVTILQHSAILARSREKNDQQSINGLNPQQNPRSEKQRSKSDLPVERSKKLPDPKVNSFFQKAIETPIQSLPHEIDELEQISQEDTVIDLERENLQKMLAEENIMKQSIHEANMKWHPNDEEGFRLSAGRYALEFLKTMNGTLCYLMVAFRMLAKAPWTMRTVCVHIRQAAILAISQGWFVNTLASHGIDFNRAALALAAGTFLGDLKPNLPDDTDQPLCLLIHELPHVCAELFSTGTAVCKSCGGSKPIPVPTFATRISWASPAWKSLRQCLEHDCIPFPWCTEPNDCSWHEGNCSRHDADVVDIQVGPWAYVSFRGDNMEELPTYSTIAEILHDTSVSHHGLPFKAVVCSNVQETSGF